MAETTQTSVRRSRGRPKKPDAELKRGILAMRIRDGMKAELARRAKFNQRSLSEEAEAIIEQALQGRELLDQALDTAFGRRITGLILTLVKQIEDTGSFAGFATTRTLDGAMDWLDNPYAYDQALVGLRAIMEGARPFGNADPPRSKDVTIDAVWAHIGQGFANSVLEAISNPDSGGGIGDWAAPIRERLGPEVRERIKAHIEAGHHIIAPNGGTRDG